MVTNYLAKKKIWLTQGEKMTVRTLSFCGDCFTVEMSGDTTFLDYRYTEDEALEFIDRFERGMVKFMVKYPCLSFVDTGRVKEFSDSTCDCCGTKIAGDRHEVELVVKTEGAKK